MQARVTKHLGDLYLLTGQLPQAHAHYWESLEALKSSKVSRGAGRAGGARWSADQREETELKLSAILSSF